MCHFQGSRRQRDDGVAQPFRVAGDVDDPDPVVRGQGDAQQRHQPTGGREGDAGLPSISTTAPARARSVNRRVSSATARAPRISRVTSAGTSEGSTVRTTPGASSRTRESMSPPREAARKARTTWTCSAVLGAAVAGAGAVGSGPGWPSSWPRPVSGPAARRSSRTASRRRRAGRRRHAGRAAAGPARPGRPNPP